ncbi:MAG TPA: GNAT family N-acetyltransferase [Terriglobales bacterium]|nr:GNAT family N-acetyltransferase [Terriglobales bacterium]
MIQDGYTDLPPGKIASVVTYLEMLTRPLPGDASSRPVHLRQIQNPDLDWYRALYRRAGAQWFWFSRLELTDEQLSARLNIPTTEFFIAEHSGSEIGLAELDRSHTPDVEITFFALFPQAMGKGLGRSLMDAVLDRAWSGSTSRVWLHTCTFDAPVALQFYLKCGFRPYKRAIEVADDPRLRGILPEDTAPHVPIIR